MRDFEVFFDWHRHWLQLSASAQKLIHALVKVKPKNWMAAFESWYFHNRLNLDYAVALPQNDDLFKGFITAYQALKKLLPKQTLALWQKRQSESLRQLRKQNKTQYQQLFANEAVTTSTYNLADLWKTASALILDFFPVLDGQSSYGGRVDCLE